MEPIEIAGRKIGGGHPVYVIAEAGVNHNGDVRLALELIREAQQCGADCVKFQTFKAESVVTRKAPKAAYQLKVTDRVESQLDMLKKLELPEDCYGDLIKECEAVGIQFLSTPYNFHDVDLLNSHGVHAFKIASGQMVETPFLEYVARLGKPIIASTGMCTMSEVEEGYRAIRQAGNDRVIILQCTTNYPSPVRDANIRAMTTIRERLKVPVGYSDHTTSGHAAYAAVALGAVVIEKHFTLDKKLPGPDHSSSFEPQEMRRYVEGIRETEQALGRSDKTPTGSELENMAGMRRSIVALKDIPAGSTILREQLEFKRPAVGLEPKRLNEVVGKRAKSSIPADVPLTPDAIEW